MVFSRWHVWHAACKQTVNSTANTCAIESMAKSQFALCTWFKEVGVRNCMRKSACIDVAFS